MFGKRTMLVALMATVLVLSAVAVASATDPSGLTNVLIGRGQASRFFEVNQRSTTRATSSFGVEGGTVGLAPTGREDFSR